MRTMYAVEMLYDARVGLDVEVGSSYLSSHQAVHLHPELDSALASTNCKPKNIRGVLDPANRELNYPHGSTVLYRAN